MYKAATLVNIVPVPADTLAYVKVLGDTRCWSRSSRSATSCPSSPFGLFNFGPFVASPLAGRAWLPFKMSPKILLFSVVTATLPARPPDTCCCR